MYPGELLAEAPVMTPYSVDPFPLLFYVVHIDLDLNMSFDCSISNEKLLSVSVNVPCVYVLGMRSREQCVCASVRACMFPVFVSLQCAFWYM